jgi:hypothetical protein
MSIKTEQKTFLNNSLYNSRILSLSTDIHNNYRPIITARPTHMHNPSIGAAAAALANNKGNGNWRLASSSMELWLSRVYLKPMEADDVLSEKCAV